MDKLTFKSVVKIINKRYPNKERKAKPFEVLVHGILSTRTKDTTTFPAQKRLLSRANTPDKILKLDTKDIEKLIYPVGFYKTKAKLLKKACEMLIKKFDSKVPSNKKDLMAIPGVGNKVASLVLEWGFNLPYVAVDTHVNRISQRLGIVPSKAKPEKTEKVIESFLEPEDRIKVNYSFVEFGREICRPINPLCGLCPVYEYCEFPMKSFYSKKSAIKE